MMFLNPHGMSQADLQRYHRKLITMQNQPMSRELRHWYLWHCDQVAWLIAFPREPQSTCARTPADTLH
jgi:hypothetical protein